MSKVNFKKLEATLAKKQIKLPTPYVASNLPKDDLETVISRIEERQIDITAVYNDWITIGFALASELGESGRKEFHRISRFYYRYSHTQCDKQYNACLRAKRNKVSLKSIFHYAKRAGIDIHCKETRGQLPTSPTAKVEGGDDQEKQEELEINTPCLPDEIYENLPEIIKESCLLFEEGTDRDVFLMGSLGVLSGCLPNLHGIYFDEFYSPHLFIFITAPASAGKGKMKWAKYFGQGIHDQMVAQSQSEKAAYDREMEQYENLNRTNKSNTVKPQAPCRKIFYIPANNSSSAFLQALADNNFKGAVFETEADTLTNSFKQEWGDFGDLLRKAFQHEDASMLRRANNEYIEVKKPHLAIALSGTPGQVFSMMPSVENGLFSRFAYYAFKDNSEFKHPFKSYCSVNYLEFFNEKARKVRELYDLLNGLAQPIEFKLTEAQGDEFTKAFNTLLSRGKLLIGRDFDANIKRLGLITFRIGMIFSALHILETGDVSSPMICNDTDFRTALNLAILLEKHAVSVFQQMPKNTLNGKKLQFFDALPVQFDRQTYLKVAEDLNIIGKTADKYINLFKKNLLDHEHNQYTKKRTDQADNPPTQPDALTKG